MELCDYVTRPSGLRRLEPVKCVAVVQMQASNHQSRWCTCKVGGAYAGQSCCTSVHMGAVRLRVLHASSATFSEMRRFLLP